MKYQHCLFAVCFILLTFPRISHSADLLVFAGAGMRSPLVELGESFTAETGISVAYDFDGSGRLGGKILMGIKPDLFIPGSDKWAMKLKQEGYVKEYVSIAYHTPVIITPKNNHKVTGLTDLAIKSNKIALGDGKACAIGRNNQKLFKSVGLDSAQMNVIARGLTVKQLVQWVESGTVDASIVWRADAVQSGRVEIIELSLAINLIDDIPICLMNQPPHLNETHQFWAYLREKGPKIFTRHGYKTLKHKL